MISIKQDAELMTNYLPANPVPAGNKFAIFRDSNSKPVLLSLSDDQKLNLVIEVNARNTLLDFGAQSGIAKDGAKVVAFALQQSPDLNLNICVATDAGDNQCDFWLVTGVSPGGLLTAIPDNKIIKVPNFDKVHHIFMSNLDKSNASSLPLVFVAFQPIDRITKEEQLGLVDIKASSSGGYSVSTNRSWSLSTNPQKIIDVAFGTCSLGDGAFVLYSTASGARKIQFKIFRSDDGDDFTVEPICPAGAACLSTFMNLQKGTSILLVGGECITSFSSKEYTSSKYAGTPITTSDNTALGIKDIHVAQSFDNISIWYTTTSDAVHYYTAKVNDLSNGRVVPLLYDGKGGQISSMLATRSINGQGSTALVNTLLSVDEYGNLTILQQDSVSGVWQKYPFYHASSMNMIPVKGYTLRIQATVDQSAEASDNTQVATQATMIQNCWLRVRSSGLINCLINGKPRELTRIGAWFQTDIDGVLNVVFATQDGSCHKIYVDCFRPADTSENDEEAVQLLDAPPLDPSYKMISKLATVRSGSDLLAARDQNGKLLLGSDITQEQADKVAGAIMLLVRQMKVVEKRDIQAFTDFKATMREQQKRKKPILSLSWWDDLCDTVGEIWNYVESGGEAVADWVCDTIESGTGTVCEFAITLGAELYQFAVDTFHNILKGISFILSTLRMDCEKVISFAGFVFNWDDILGFSDNIVVYLNHGLNFGQKQLDGLSANIKSCLEDLRPKIKEVIASSTNENSIADVKTRTDSGQDDMRTLTNSVGFNWVTYQMKYGGFSTNVEMTTLDQSEDSNAKLLAGMWSDILKQLETGAGLAKEVVDDFLAFASSPSIDLKTLLVKITTGIIDAAVDTLENVSDIMIKAVSLALGATRTLGDSVIQCPIFSNIWELITDGRPLTLFNFCGFLAAIPATLMYKTILGKAPPPTFEGRLTADTFREFVWTGKVAANEILSIDLVSVSATALVGAKMLLTGVESISLLADFAFEGNGLGMTFLAPTIGATNFGTIMPAEPGPKWTLLDVVFDAVALTFKGLGCLFTLPLFYDDTTDGDEAGHMIYRLRWGAWIMDASNALAIFAAWAAGAKAGISHIVTKRARAFLAGATCLPTLGMKIAVIVHEYSVNQELAACIRHATSVMLDAIADVGFIAASWADKSEGPEAEAIQAAGYFVFFSSEGGSVLLTLPDIVEVGKEMIHKFDK